MRQERDSLSIVMPGAVPGIHLSPRERIEGVVGRDKSGHAVCCWSWC